MYVFVALEQSYMKTLAFEAMCQQSSFGIDNKVSSMPQVIYD